MEKEYEVGEVFEDPKTGELVKCVADPIKDKASCNNCYYLTKSCGFNICSSAERIDDKGVHFIRVEEEG